MYNCEGCLTNEDCWVQDKVYSCKYNVGECPCIDCLIKVTCTESCEKRKILVVKINLEYDKRILKGMKK